MMQVYDNMTNETLRMSGNPWNERESAGIVIFVWMIILTGILGNTLVIVVTLINYTLKTTANALIVNLAIADILALCSFAIMTSSLAKGKWTYGHTACQVNGFAVMTFALASALSISAISINRYLVTVNLTAYRSVFGAKNRTLFLLVSLWIFAGTFGSLPLFGWSKYEYFPARGFCAWHYSTSLSYTITFYTLVTPCCLAAAFCYWKIYLTIRRNKLTHIRKSSLSTPESSNRVKRRQECSSELSERKITLSICVVVLVYYTALAPFTIVNLMVIWKPGFKITPSVDIVTTIVAMMNHVINVFIYSTLNRKYRQAIRNLIEKIKKYFWPSANGNRVQSVNRTKKQTPKNGVTWC